MRATQTTQSFCRTFFLLLSVSHLVRSQDTSTVTTIDDRDPAIQYKGVWAPISDDGKSHNGTVMLSRAAGGTATFKFNGVRVSVFGTQGTPGGNTTISTYSVDNSSPSQYTVPTGLTKYQFGVEFYSSPSLPEGEHTLVVTNLNDQAWYWLDFIQVTSPAGAVAPTSTSSDKTSDPTLAPITTPTVGNTQPTPTSTPITISTTIPTSTPIAGITTQQATTTTPTPASQAVPIPTADNIQQQSKAGISKGAIAGIALGVSALIVLLLAALWWKRRHTKPTEGESTADHERSKRPRMHGNTLLEPYQVEHFAPSSNTPASRNGLNEKRTYNDAAPISSTENHANASHSLVTGHTSDSSTTQYASEITRSEASISRPISFSKSRPLYRGAPSSGNTESPSSAPVSQMPMSVSTPSSQIPSSNRRSTDGGVRIAGGPPGTEGEELEEINDTATLPPAYGSY